MNISVSPSKTEIGASEIEFLGYKLSADSVRMTDKHIQAIDKISAPKKRESPAEGTGHVKLLEKTRSALL